MCEANIVSKIRKLLALSEGKGATPAEAAAAAALAQRLMAKHRISASTIETPAQEQEPIGTHHAFHRKQRHANWIVDLVCGVARVNACRCLIYPRSIQIIGRESDRQAAEYFAHYLTREIDRLAKEQCRGQGKSYANSFRYGAVYTVLQRLREENKEERQAAVNAGLASTALVRVDMHEAAVQAYVDERTSGTRQHSGPRFNAGLMAGKTAGASIALNKGMSGKGPAKLLK